MALRELPGWCFRPGSNRRMNRPPITRGALYQLSYGSVAALPAPLYPEERDGERGREP